MKRNPPHSSPTEAAQRTGSAWQPLKQSLFRALWIASLASNIATWMHDVGAAWLMTSLAPSPLMVSMVQAATSLPLFALALPAGAFADVFDRRRLLLMTQGWMLLAAAGLAFLTFAGQTGPVLLLGFTIAIGVGTAFNAPAWQAIVPEIVPREDIPAAIALKSAGINLARAVGPALGGIVVAQFGPQAAFGLNALSFICVIIVLYSWKREERASSLPPEHLFAAMVAGLRYARHVNGFRSVLGRTLCFVFPASALWALLPLLARQELGMSATGYGVLLGGVGLGAVTGALFLPRLRRKIAVDKLTAAATMVYALVLVALAMVRNAPLLVVVMLASGAMWITMLTALNVAAQSVAAGWVRARVLSVYLIFFYGSMAIGSLVWGALATALTMAPVFMLAAVLAGVGTVANRWLPLASTEGIDLSPSLHWPSPMIEDAAEGGAGPVLVNIEYHIDSARDADFRRLMQSLRASRLRDGAIGWQLYSDPTVTGRYLEQFMVGSWLNHLRQHERVTASDAALQDRLRTFLQDGSEPVVTHLIAKTTRP
ncbi:MAG: MFS transporter [Desulfosarcinaceae bacterium]|nr:MFS transporter [Desulfosarcinaceae bacterium]